MGLEDAEALVGGGGAEGAGEGGVEADRGVVGGAELEVEGALGDPGRVLEDAAEAGDEGVLGEGGRALGDGRRGVAGAPVGGDLGAGGEPGVAAGVDVVEEAGEAGGAAGAAGEAAVQADRHHLRRAGGAFGPEGVEAVAQVGEEVLAGLERAGGEAHVVGLERVGDDQLLAVAVLAPVGEVVVVGVGDPVEGAGLAGEVDGRDRGAAGVPAARGLAGDFGVQADRLGEVGGLGFAAVVAVVDPLQAVAGDLPAGFLHGGDLGGGAGEGGGDAVDGDRDGARGQQVVEAPEAGAGAVLVDRFHVPVALARPGLGAGDLGEEGLGGGVAVEEVVLAALLVVEDDLDGDVGAAGPVGEGRVAAVAVHVAWVAHGSPAVAFGAV